MRRHSKRAVEAMRCFSVRRFWNSAAEAASSVRAALLAACSSTRWEAAAAPNASPATARAMGSRSAPAAVQRGVTQRHCSTWRFRGKGRRPCRPWSKLLAARAPRRGRSVPCTCTTPGLVPARTKRLEGAEKKPHCPAE